MKAFWVLTMALFCFKFGNGQNNSQEIIQGLLSKFRQVETYEAQAVIKPDISFLRVLPQKATLYFKQPDKFRMKTEGISILPKQNIDNVFSLLTDEKAYSAVAGPVESDSVFSLNVLNLIPTSDTSDLMMAKLWIDDKNDVIRKARITTRSNGTIFIVYHYDKYLKEGLPDRIVFTIELKKFKLPKAITADINSQSKSESKKEVRQGYIYVDITNYKINSTIPEGIFDK